MKLGAVYAGDETFDAMARRSMREFERLASYVLRKQPGLSPSDRDDVLQEMMIACWCRMTGAAWRPGKPTPKWDPARGVPLERYCVFNAVVQGRRWAKKTRRSIGVPLASAEPGESRDELEAAAAKQGMVAEPHDLGGAREVQDLLDAVIKACDSPIELVFVVAVRYSGGDAEAAARRVYSDPELRSIFRIGNELEASEHAAAAAKKFRRTARTVGRCS